MKKYISIFLSVLFCSLLQGCNDTAGPELIFSEVANSAPENIQFYFSSPEPELVPRTAIIYTNQFGGEMTIKSTNVSSFILGYTSDPENNFYTCPVEGGEADSKFYFCERGNWTAELIDDNVLVFKIGPIDTDVKPDYDMNDYLAVSAIVKGKVVNTLITVSRSIDHRFVEKPPLPDKEINTEDDIEYYALCPFKKYDIDHCFRVDKDGGIIRRENGTALPYDMCRIYLEVIMDKGDPDFLTFNSVPYMAIFSYVISPLSDKIRLVRNDSSGLMFKDVVTEDEYRYILDSMKPGEELHYSLILANINKLGLQKLEFTVRKL